MTSGSPVRVLCLHGAHSNAARLKKSMKTLLQKAHKKHGMEMDFLQAQFQTENDRKDGNEYTHWWSFPTEGDMFVSDAYDTVEESLQQLEEAWTTGKYDILFGFSQGSALAQLFAFRLAQRQHEPRPKAIVLCSTFDISPAALRWNVEQHGLFAYCPIVCCVGERDDLIPPERSCAAVNRVFAPQCVHHLSHAGGHYVPSRADAVEELLTIIAQYLLKCV